MKDNKYDNHLKIEKKVDVVLERKIEEIDLNAHDIAKYLRGDGWGESCPSSNWTTRDRVIVTDKKTGSIRTVMDTDEAKRVYGIIPEKRKKIWLHIYSPCEFDNYNNQTT